MFCLEKAGINIISVFRSKLLLVYLSCCTATFSTFFAFLCLVASISKAPQSRYQWPPVSRDTLLFSTILVVCLSRAFTLPLHHMISPARVTSSTSRANEMASVTHLPPLLAPSLPDERRTVCPQSDARVSASARARCRRRCPSLLHLAPLKIAQGWQRIVARLVR